MAYLFLIFFQRKSLFFCDFLGKLVQELREKIEFLELELKERRKEFEDKESELNWVYQQKLEHASGTHARFIQQTNILKTQSFLFGVYAFA